MMEQHEKASATVANVGCVDDDALEAELHGLVPATVVARVATISARQSPPSTAEGDLVRDATPARQREFATGRALAHLAMASIGYQATPILRGRHRQPLWPQGLVGSITHGVGVCAVLVARSSEVWALGVDIESAVPAAPAAASAVARFALSEAERDICAGTGLSVLQVFSVKEAVFKALYPRVGRYFGFLAAAVLSPAEGRVPVRLTRTLGPNLPAGSVIEAKVREVSGFLFSVVCLTGPPGAPGYLARPRPAHLTGS
jgi:enterobactin synthetase component D